MTVPAQVTDAMRERAREWLRGSDAIHKKMEHYDADVERLAALFAQVIAEEREECARVADAKAKSERNGPASARGSVIGYGRAPVACEEVAAAIRSRGLKG